MKANFQKNHAQTTNEDTFASQNNQKNQSCFSFNNVNSFKEPTINESHIFLQSYQNQIMPSQIEKSQLILNDQFNQLQKQFNLLTLLHQNSCQRLYEESTSFNTHFQNTNEEQLHSQCYQNNYEYQTFSQEILTDNIQSDAKEFSNNNQTVDLPQQNSFIPKQNSNQNKIEMPHYAQYSAHYSITEDSNSNHYQPSLFLQVNEDRNGNKQQNEFNQRMVEETMSSLEEQREDKDEKKQQFIKRIIDQTEENWNEFSETDDEYLLSLYEKIDKNNVNKNILSSFVKYILQKGDDIVVECLDSKQKELYKIRKELKNFTKNKKFNNNTIISFFDSKRYSNQFQYYLKFYAIDYYQKSRVNDKNSHFICITFSLRCFSNDTLRKNIVIYNKSKYFKTINKSRLNNKSSPLQSQYTN